MVQIRTNLGGQAPASNEPGIGATTPGGQPEHWRDKYQEYYSHREPIDWADPQYATPKPAPKTIFGRRVVVKPDIPSPPLAMLRVRSKPPAVYYDADGNPIPDEWTVVAMTPGILEAIKAGDLERDNSYAGGPPPGSQPQQHGGRVRHHAQVSPDSAKT